MDKFKKHLKAIKNDCKQHILDIVQENNGFKFTSSNLYCAIEELKTIEIIESFIESDDFMKIKNIK